MSRREALVEKFRGVVAERLAKLKQGLAALAVRADDREVCADVERELHTLKGEAKLLGFTDMGRVAHALESLLAAADHLGAAEQHRFAASQPAVALMQTGFELIDRLRAGPAADDPLERDVSAFFDRASAIVEAQDP
jgi:chemotaxis protein histidine kinase CheA